MSQDMGVEALTALGLGPQTFLAVYDGHGGAEASAFLWQRLHINVAEALEDAAPRIAAALDEDEKARGRECRRGDGGAAVGPGLDVAPGGVSAGGGAVSRRDGRSHGRDGSDGGVVRGGDGADVVGVDGAGGDDDVIGIDIGLNPGVGRPPKASGDASPDRGSGLLSPMHYAPPPPLVLSRGRDMTCDAAARPAVAEGVDAGGGQACTAGASHGSQRVTGGAGDDDWPAGWEESGVDQSSPGVESEGVEGKGWGWRVKRSPSVSLSVVPWPVAETPAPGGVSREACLARGWASDGETGYGGDDREDSPVLRRDSLAGEHEESGRSWDVAAGGDAANGVQTEKDGAGGSQGGTNGDHGAGAFGALCGVFDSVRPGGVLRRDSGGEFPSPAPGVRSGAQSPGGEPSRSLETAGLPAEGEGGRKSGRSKGAEQLGEPKTSVDRYKKGDVFPCSAAKAR